MNLDDDDDAADSIKPIDVLPKMYTEDESDIEGTNKKESFQSRVMKRKSCQWKKMENNWKKKSISECKNVLKHGLGL